MNQELIIASNKLIVEFMELPNEGNSHYRVLNKNTTDILPLFALEYHWSWDWLMPVIEKIESLVINNHSIEFTINNNYCNIHLMFDDTEFSGEGKTKIESVYKTILQFLTWYNENSTKTL